MNMDQSQWDGLLNGYSPWIATAIVAVVAVVGVLIALRIGTLVLRRATVHTPVVRATLTEIIRPASFVAPLFALQLVWQAAPDALRFIDGVRHLNGLMLIGAVTWLVMAAIRGLSSGIQGRQSFDADDNLEARRVMTQTRVLARTATTIVALAGLSMMLMTFPGARQVGASLLASAGVVGIIAGLAAKPVFSNLVAGLQLALTQPIRIDDVLIVSGEWGRVEEITGTYVVLKIWDERRMIIPLQWFIENPFQNWTRTGAQLMGSVFLNVDYRMPVAALRAELERLVPTLGEWDGRFFNLQVTDSSERTMQLRVLVTAATSSQAFDLRCKVREAMIAFMQREYPAFLPTLRISGIETPAAQAGAQAGVQAGGVRGGTDEAAVLTAGGPARTAAGLVVADRSGQARPVAPDDQGRSLAGVAASPGAPQT